MNIAYIVVLLLVGRMASAADPLPTIASEDLAAHFEQQQPGTSQRVLVQLYNGSSGVNLILPVTLLKGLNGGPRLAVTAAIHGDEVTGVVVLQNFLEQFDIEQLRGDIIVIPVLNPFGFARYQRGGFAGKDLNRSFRDGSLTGEEKHYADRLLQMLKSCDLGYHVDFHTATTNNDNSFYVRADLSSPVAQDMARVVQPQIILNATGPGDSLRQAMTASGVHAITVEMGGPIKVNDEFVRGGVKSLSNVLRYLQMIDNVLLENDVHHEPVVCSSSKWICTSYSGLVFEKVNILDNVKAGDVVAEIKTMFGESVLNLTVPFDGIVIGKTDRLPVQYGARIVHVGKVERHDTDSTSK